MPDHSHSLPSDPAATTRRTRSIHVPIEGGPHLLVPDQVVVSPETKLQYRIERLLGEGGFGQAYLARRLGRSTVVPEQVCIKVSPRIDEYLRARYRASMKDALKFGLIRKEFDVDSWFDPSLLEQVLKEENLVGYWPDRPLK